MSHIGFYTTLIKMIIRQTLYFSTFNCNMLIKSFLLRILSLVKVLQLLVEVIDDACERLD